RLDRCAPSQPGATCAQGDRRTAESRRPAPRRALGNAPLRMPLSSRSLDSLPSLAFQVEMCAPAPDSLPGQRTEGQHGQLRLNALRVQCRRLNGERYMRQQIELANDQRIADAKRLRILAGLVVAFRDAEQEYAQVAANVMRRRANQIADILDK